MMLLLMKTPNNTQWRMQLSVGNYHLNKKRQPQTMAKGSRGENCRTETIARTGNGLN
jgi:hypothetical protein